MMNKVNDILQQFSREIDHTAQIFDVHRNAPPLTRNQSPVAGAIKWSRSLFARVKQTMNKLMGVETDIRGEDSGKEVHGKYMSFARTVMNFEKERFAAWSETADAIAMHHLKQPILRKHPESGRSMFIKI